MHLLLWALGFPTVKWTQRSCFPFLFPEAVICGQGPKGPPRRGGDSTLCPAVWGQGEPGTSLACSFPRHLTGIPELLVPLL